MCDAIFECRLKELLDLPSHVFEFSDSELEVIDTVARRLFDLNIEPSVVDKLRILVTHKKYKRKCRRTKHL